VLDLCGRRSRRHGRGSRRDDARRHPGRHRGRTRRQNPPLSRG
jgi:hypothetical protein